MMLGDLVDTTTCRRTPARPPRRRSTRRRLGQFGGSAARAGLSAASDEDTIENWDIE
jgi:hypothetical protein